MSEYSRIQYKRCKVFGDGKGGRLTTEIDKNGNVVNCCYGANDNPTEWATICNECLSCPKWINNV